MGSDSSEAVAVGCGGPLHGALATEGFTGEARDVEGYGDVAAGGEGEGHRRMQLLAAALATRLKSLNILIDL